MGISFMENNAKKAMSTIEFLWCISQQLVVAKDKAMVNITGFGSGFFIMHEDSLFFVTADHVLHWDDHKKGERISKDSYLFIANNKRGEGLTSAYTPLGEFYYFDKYDFADLFGSKDIDPEVASIPELQDFAFCLRKNEFQCQFYTHELSDCDGNVIVPSNLEKLIISSQAATTPNKEDYYIVAGCVMYNVVGARIDRCNTIHQDMKFDRMDSDNIILKSPENIIYEHWAGLSGSPVLNQSGKLLGVIIRVNCETNEVTIIPIDKILRIMKCAKDIESGVQH